MSYDRLEKPAITCGHFRLVSHLSLSLLVFAFSMSVNSTLSAAGYAATVLESIQNYITNSPGRAILLVVVYSPFLAIILNVLKQLVCTQECTVNQTDTSADSSS